MPETYIYWETTEPTALVSLDTGRNTAEGTQYEACVEMANLLTRDGSTDEQLEANKPVFALLAEVEALPWDEESIHGPRHAFRDDAPISTYEVLTDLCDELESLTQDAGYYVGWDGYANLFYVSELPPEPDEDDYLISSDGNVSVVGYDRWSVETGDTASALLAVAERMESEGYFPNIWVEVGWSYELVTDLVIWRDGQYLAGSEATDPRLKATA